VFCHRQGEVNIVVFLNVTEIILTRCQIYFCPLKMHRIQFSQRPLSWIWEREGKEEKDGNGKGGVKGRERGEEGVEGGEEGRAGVGGWLQEGEFAP